MVLGIIKMALCLRGWHVLYDNHWKVLDIFGTLTFSKNWSTVFHLKVLGLETQHFHTKLPSQNSVLRQIEWSIQNGPVTKNGLF